MTRNKTESEDMRLHAPGLYAALNRHTPHATEASAALDVARALYRRVDQLQLEGREIVFTLAEALFDAHMRGRRDVPRIEAQAAASAIAGAKALVGSLRDRLQALEDEQSRRAEG